jgi:sigma-E factor negative regulatory protein RseC
MSKTPARIVHEGKIVEMDKESISVEIVNKSACAACHAKGVCGASDEQVRTIVLPQTLATATAGYQVGDSVKLVLSASLGMKAVILAYGLPLLVLLVAILVFSALKLEQLYVGLFSLAAVAVYYIIFAIFRDKLDKEFVFHIEQ